MQECVLEFLSNNAMWTSADGSQRTAAQMSRCHLAYALSCIESYYNNSNSCYCGFTHETWKSVFKYQAKKLDREMAQEAARKARERLHAAKIELEAAQSEVYAAQKELEAVSCFC